jgi:hypothetical protein
MTDLLFDKHQPRFKTVAVDLYVLHVEFNNNRKVVDVIPKLEA